MKIIKDFDMNSFEEWLKTRPLIIQEMAKKYPPNKFYKIRGKGHICTLYSYSEDKTVSVDITGDFNKLTIERRVFDVNIDDLVETEFDETQPTGVLFTKEDDIEDHIKIMRNNLGFNEDVENINPVILYKTTDYLQKGNKL